MNLEMLQNNLTYILFGGWLAGGAPGGLMLTIFMSVAACILASALGLAGGITLVMGSLRWRIALETVIAVLRGIPVIMLIFWCYFLLPILLGLNAPGMVTVIAALAIINGAYLSQAVAAGLRAVAPGQWDAGLALGFSRGATLRLIILPQALRIMLPSFVNQWVTLIKDTSLAFIIGVPELTMVAGQVNSREQVYPLQIYLLTALLYFLLCNALSLTLRRLESRYGWPAS